VLKVEASVRYNRPLRTTIADPPDGLPGAKPTCHGGYDASNGFISSIMIADANDSADQLGVPPGFVGKNRPLPFWSHLFAYYMPDAYGTIGLEAMRVVRTDRRWGRALAGTVVRDIEQGEDEYDILWKEARQGEFDNIHMAPTLRLNGATAALVARKVLLGLMEDEDRVDITDPDSHEHLRLNDISMAPFCVHDCLHTHWRWGTQLDEKAVLGWNENGPNAKAGAPQVPVNQDISVWMRSPCQMTYHAWAGRDDGSVGALSAGAWQVIMHHGSAYAVSVSNGMKYFLAQTGVSLLHDGGLFYATDPSTRGAALEDRRLVPISEYFSHAVMYWHLRYVLEGAETEIRTFRDLRARERTTVKSMEMARKL
jgi:hypothetical protein